MRKTLILLAAMALPAGLAPAGEIVEKTFTNTQGQQVQIKVFSSTTRSSTSSRSSYGSRSRTSRGTPLRTGAHYPYSSYRYSSYGSRYPVYRAPITTGSYCAPYRYGGSGVSISVGGVSSRGSLGIRLGR